MKMKSEPYETDALAAYKQKPLASGIARNSTDQVSEYFKIL